MIRADEPSWIGAVLTSPATDFCARALLVSAYLIGGVTKLMDFRGAVAEQAHFGLHPPALWAVLAIVLELAGPILILFNRAVWLAAGALGVLTLIATSVAFDFWTQSGPARFVAMNGFFEHLGLIGGFALLAVLRHRVPGAPRNSRAWRKISTAAQDRR
jgi:uncharacterized membrane protein YphA (DoxX/SURF4 family)